jgi:hypothetical protein|tara:strand:- start:1879 stop:2220 length:342 start_codon:yes stop_codon:yes gene_type:complete
MAKLIKLTEKDLRRVVDRVIEEQRMGSVAVGMDSGFVKETEGKPEDELGGHMERERDDMEEGHCGDTHEDMEMTISDADPDFPTDLDSDDEVVMEESKTRKQLLEDYGFNFNK